MARELTERRFWVHALGGGSGHAVRGAALAQELARRGVPTVLAVRGELEQLVRGLGVQRVVSYTTERGARALAAELRAALDAEAVTDLVADVFPEGIIGELEALRAAGCRGVRRVALLRLRSDARSRGFLEALDRFDRAFDLEPHLAWLPAGTQAEPTRPFTRALLESPNADGPSPEVRLIASERRLEPCFGALAARLCGRGVHAVLGSASTGRPLLTRTELAARVVVGPAGYNLTYELERLGAWHVAVPLARRFDVQERRARGVAEACFSPEAVERRVLALLAGARRRPPPRYAEDAGAFVSRLLA